MQRRRCYTCRRIIPCHTLTISFKPSCFKYFIFTLSENENKLFDYWHASRYPGVISICFLNWLLKRYCIILFIYLRGILYHVTCEKWKPVMQELGFVSLRIIKKFKRVIRTKCVNLNEIHNLINVHCCFYDS